MGIFHDENIFNEVLEKLDFSISNNISNEESPKPEIVFVSNPPENLHPKHYIALEFAESLEATAVYFRYYEDNRYCVPQVYFYDNNRKNRSNSDISEIHKKVYSSCQVPLICFIDDISITMYDCRIPVKEIKNGISNKSAIFKKPESIHNLETLKKYFSAKKLNFGFFWENEESENHFLNNKSAYEKLVGVLSDLRKGFIKNFVKEGISQSFADDLLFKCILIKYLEEQGKTDEKDYAKEFYQNKNLSHNSLNNFLTRGKITELFIALENHFNGGVFKISEEEKNLIEKTDLTILATLLEGTLDKNNQSSIWKIYSFKDIPIELISNFYEEFIPKDKENKGTVYTPSFLVNLLIDECLPLSPTETNYNVKLIDVSCGSGIFISSAFKRLVQRWRVSKGKNGKPLEKEKIKKKDVKEILTKCIYGVDKNGTAVKLSKFSLQLAYCQIVPNNELWRWTDEDVFEKVFDDLNENIVESDFFDFLTDKNKSELHSSFDLIIGNPPFFGIGEKKYKEYKEKLKKINFEFKVDIPRKQLALLFLEVSPILLNKTGRICFIQKSTSLLYNQDKKSIDFKNHFFNNNHVSQIIDFTLLKDCLFENAMVETCAVFYDNQKKDNYLVNHIVSRLLKVTKESLSFEFDYYDFFEIPKETIIKDNAIWRSNLLNGTRLNHLLNKLNNKNSFQTTLKDYVYNFLNLEKERYAIGFQISTEDNSANFITEKRILFNELFENEKIEFKNLPATQKFGRTRNAILYEEPLIVIKKNISNNTIPIEYLNIDTAFDERIVGISFPKNKRDECKKLLNNLKENQKINILKTISSCSQFYYRGDTAILKQDVDNWTIPILADKIELSKEEIIIVEDVLNYIYPSWYKGFEAEINKNNATEIELVDYAEVYNDLFNSIYKKNDRQQILKKIIKGKDFYALEFFYGDKVSKTEIIENEEELSFLINNEISRTKTIKRIIRIDGKNSTTFIKPKNLRYWLKSIALRDADDLFEEIIENGLRNG